MSSAEERASFCMAVSAFSQVFSPKGIVLIDLVEAVGQRALPFFFPHHIGVARDGGRVGKGDRLPAQLFWWS